MQEERTMLVRFRVKNFLSFHEEQVFSMTAKKLRSFSERVYRNGKYNLLRFMSIYGANASGKSNLVSAFGVFKSIVIGGLGNNSFPYFCKVDEADKDRPSLFEIVIDYEGKIFVYGFEIILYKNSILHEWLYEEMKNGSINDIFDRDIVNGSIHFGNYIKPASYIERLNIYGEDVKTDDSILFLKLMNQNKDSLYKNKNSDKIAVFKRIYSWIRFNLSVNSPEMPITNYTWLIDKNNLDEISKTLETFATGIETVTIDDVSPDKVAADIPKEMLRDVQEMLLEQKNQNIDNPAVLVRNPYNAMFIILTDAEGSFTYKTFKFKHHNSSSVFSLEEESDGTVRLLDIIEILLNKDTEKVYVVDEINRMFHPLLTRRFVKEYLEMAKSRNTQLIVTTHESQLMDLSLLRKDEISFVNKDTDGNTSVYSLTKYDDRYDKRIVTDYFKGKYNAIPFPINTT